VARRRAGRHREIRAQQSQEPAHRRHQLCSAVISENHAEIGRTFLHRWAAANQLRLLPLADRIDDSKWDSYSNLGYQTSAAFLAYLIDQYGIAKLMQIYYAHSNDFTRRAQEVYGKPIEQLQADWLANLR
jgi:hypothetical protein